MLNTENLASVLESTPVHKGPRKNGTLSAKEIAEFVNAIVASEDDIFTAITETEKPQAGPKWFGLDAGNNVTYTSNTKEDILSTWITDVGEDPEKLIRFKLQRGAYYYAFVKGVNPEDRHEINILHVDVLPDYGIDVNELLQAAGLP